MTAEEMDRLGLVSFLHGWSGNDLPKCKQAADVILQLFTKSMQHPEDQHRSGGT